MTPAGERRAWTTRTRPTPGSPSRSTRRAPDAHARCRCTPGAYVPPCGARIAPRDRDAAEERHRPRANARVQASRGAGGEGERLALAAGAARCGRDAPGGDDRAHAGGDGAGALPADEIAGRYFLSVGFFTITTGSRHEDGPGHDEPESSWSGWRYLERCVPEPANADQAASARSALGRAAFKGEL